jgi:hypothetical protein
VSDATARFRNVAVTPWDEVPVRVKDGLAGRFANVQSDVEANDVEEPGAQVIPQLAEQVEARQHLIVGQFEEMDGVSLRDDQ